MSSIYSHTRSNELETKLITCSCLDVAFKIHKLTGDVIQERQMTKVLTQRVEGEFKAKHCLHSMFRRCLNRDQPPLAFTGVLQRFYKLQ